ncbi:MAG: hypothetical protein IAI48_09365, partial [Candidatus Eremiobacteraeota bacterium]|nr:hypothetical protein [Candidatus Eremiobacteraeota bacterium]
GAGVIGLLLGTQTSQQIASQNTSTSPAGSSALTNSNDVILGALGTSANGAATGSDGDAIADAIAASLGSTGGYSAGASSSVGANGGLGAIASLFGGGGSGIGTSGGIAGGSGLGGLGGGLGSLLDKIIPPTASGDVYDQDGNLLSSGGISSASGSLGSVLSGLGLGIGLNSILGGNSTNGAIGSALGAGVGLIGGPVGSLIGGGLGGILGGLFGNHTTPAGSPDIYNTKQYGGIIADLVGNSQANGLLSYEDSQTYKAFNGQTGLAGVEELLSGGQAAFTQETGLSAAQYAQYVKMFGESSTGSGTLDAEKNIGQRYVTGATGATGVYSYTQYGQALAAIESGLSATGVVGPYDSYTFSRSYPNYNAGTLTAGANSTTSPAKIVTGSGSTTVGTGNASTDAAHISPIAGGLGAVSLTITNPIFVGSSSETAATLASLIQKAQQGQSKGLLTNTATNTYARTPTV